MTGGHISPRLGNLVLIGLVAVVAVPLAHAVAAYLASTNLPVVAPAADGFLRITAHSLPVPTSTPAAAAA